MSIYFLKHRQTIVIIPNLYVLYKNEYLFFKKKYRQTDTHRGVGKKNLKIKLRRQFVV